MEKQLSTRTSLLPGPPGGDIWLNELLAVCHFFSAVLERFRPLVIPWSRSSSPADVFAETSIPMTAVDAALSNPRVANQDHFDLAGRDSELFEPGRLSIRSIPFPQSITPILL
jgi:hypothetical protein